MDGDTVCGDEGGAVSRLVDAADCFLCLRASLIIIKVAVGCLLHESVG